ncbi:MAG: hypothetical protein KatS3mg065_0173 [Chloroflexota bacterium]|nr:MAG: hypothetical protein KatS3mg065_0173 [Chloroflexota bacterium]
MPQRRSRTPVLVLALLVTLSAWVPLAEDFTADATVGAERRLSEASIPGSMVVALSPECRVPTSQPERAAADVAAAQFVFTRVALNAADLRVCPVDDGFLVVEKGAKLASVSSERAEVPSGLAGRYVASLFAGHSIAPMGDTELLASLGQTAAAPYWRERESNCFAWDSERFRLPGSLLLHPSAHE